MPAGNITQIDRMKRMMSIRDLKEEGKTSTEISTELGISIQAVNRNIKYLDDLAIADLTSKELSEKRQEIYLELCEAAVAAREEFELYKGSYDNNLGAKRFFDAWLETLKLKASLYGLDSAKIGQLVQVAGDVNNTYVRPDTYKQSTVDSITKALKKEHESKFK